MRKGLLAVVLTVVLVAAGCGGDDDDAADVDTGNQADSGQETSVELEADDFYFEPEAVDARAGDTITIEVENEGDATHTFSVDALDIDEEIAPGDTAEIEVTVPDGGGVDFYCRFHEGRGMKGTIGGGSGADSESDTDDSDSGGGGSPNGY